MLKAIAMMGNTYIVEKMKKELKRIDVNLESQDFQTLEQILDKIQDEVIDMVFMMENAIFSADIKSFDSKEILRQSVLKIREREAELKIVIFCDEFQRDYSLEEWLKHQRVHDVFYPDLNGEFQMNQIIKQLKETSLKQNKVEIREKIVQVVETIEVPVEIEKEVIREVIIEKPVYILEHGPDQKVVRPTVSALSIAVFNLSHGAGATFTTLLLAKACQAAGYKTAVIACDGKSDLQRRKKDSIKVIIASEKNFESEIIKLNKEGFRIIILDMGNVVSISDEEVSQNEILLEKLLKIQHRIGVGFSTEWHLPILDYYAQNFGQDDFIFAIQDAESIMRRYKDLNICERDHPDTISLMLELIGVN